MRPRSRCRRTACRRTRLHGFTLVELLVVIAVIALLAGLVVPTFTGIIARTKDWGCMINLRGLTNALKAYTTDHMCFPYIQQKTVRADSSTYHKEYINYWKDYVIFDNDAQGIGWTNLGLLWSPKADRNVNVPEGKYVKNEDHFYCPLFHTKNNLPANFGYNHWLPRLGYRTKSSYSRRPAVGGKMPGTIPDGAAIVADYFPRAWWYAQKPEHVHQNATGFHVGYYSGVVDWFDDQDGLALDIANFQGNTWIESRTRTEQSWRELDKVDVPWDATNYLP